MASDAQRLGYYSGLSAFIATAFYAVAQVLQVVHVIGPPLDEILIYGSSLAIVIPFLLAMLSLHYVTPTDRQIWTHGALLFTGCYAIFVTANYVVQLATVLPASMRGDVASVALLRQTPHSLFWDFDALGYIFMGFADLMAVPALGTSTYERRLRIGLLANAAMTPFIAIVYFYPTYSTTLLLLGFPWGITAPAAMLLLALRFRHWAQGHTQLAYKT